MKRFILLLFVFSSPLLAELSLPHFFSNGMVLQRDREVAIWGMADPGANVTINFKGRQANVWSDADGAWKAKIDSGPADAKGADLLISNGPEVTTLQNVLVGEVWLASGQSNMVFTMNRVPAYESVTAHANFPEIRMFNAPLVTAVEPQSDIEGHWSACSPDTAPGYSAVAFFFARMLHRELDVPIGIIKTAWGGKPVETFTSREALRSLPETRPLVDAAVKADQSYDPQKARQRFDAEMVKWEADDAAWRAQPVDQRDRRPRKPVLAKRALDTEGQPGVLFNAMIHPFAGYTMQGAIWYQGEANAKRGRVPYDVTLSLMIRDWRARWNDPFYFNFVQLANYRQPSTKAGTPSSWALLQDRQRLILNFTPKTGMATINDTGEVDDIHPKNKHDVGERLARWALSDTYGLPIVRSGPLFAKATYDKGAATIEFQYVGKGLKARDGKALQRFEIAGADKVWRWANAKVVSQNSIQVVSAAVSNPVAVRYAWADNPEGANLVNSEDLPASVFRTDDWDDAE